MNTLPTSLPLETNHKNKLDIILNNFIRHIEEIINTQTAQLLVEKQEIYYENLHKTINHLKNKYNIQVQLLLHYQNNKEETAGWKNNIIGINTKNKESFGSLFILAHVFGHLVQFSSEKDYSKLFQQLKGKKPLTLSQDFKEEYFQFEKEAFEIGNQLLYEVPNIEFIRDHQELYKNFMMTDYEHYWHFLTTGKIGDMKMFYLLWDHFMKNNNVNNNILNSQSNPFHINQSSIQKLNINVV